jgi:hypothetical protein
MPILTAAVIQASTQKPAIAPPMIAPSVLILVGKVGVSYEHVLSVVAVVDSIDEYSHSNATSSL